MSRKQRALGHAPLQTPSTPIRRVPASNVAAAFSAHPRCRAQSATGRQEESCAKPGPTQQHFPRAAHRQNPT
eukprot:6117217-Alexandrium_andersonii.AAC.1